MAHDTAQWDAAMIPGMSGKMPVQGNYFAQYGS
jgi:hypothetical protein